MIGTAVPASPKSRQRQEGRQGPKVRSPPTGIEAFSREQFGVSREEAQEELIFLKRDAASSDLRVAGSEAGRKSGRPKKGRRPMTIPSGVLMLESDA